MRVLLVLREDCLIILKENYNEVRESTVLVMACISMIETNRALTVI